MRYANPKPISRADEEMLRLRATEILGKRVKNVRYRYPAGTVWPADFLGLRESFDEVGMAVVIDFDDARSLIVSWAMQGFSGGLDVEVGRSDVIAPLPELEDEFDVTQVAQWREVIGETIEAVGVAWDVFDGASHAQPDSLEALWSLRIDFSGGVQIAIALGAYRQFNVQYLPDSLIVLYNADDARAYLDSASQNSAFGEIVAALSNS